MRTAVITACLLAAVSVSLAQPPVPQTPAAIDEVVYARPFVLREGFRYDWANEPFQVSQGTILVLKVNTNLVVPRQIGEPTLYVGNQAAMRLNQGDKSGHVIAIVPGDVDLAKDLIWFGGPGLPGRTDANTIKAEREKAEKAGLKPLTTEKAGAARDKGGAAVNAPDMSALLRTTLAELVEQYSPQEKALAESWRLPVVERPAKP